MTKKITVEFTEDEAFHVVQALEHRAKTQFSGKFADKHQTDVKTAMRKVWDARQ